MADIINIKDHNQDISDINTKIGDENSGLIKEVNDIKGTELQNLNASIQTLETLIGVDETLGDKNELPSGDANVIASINRIDSKPSGTVTDEQISTAVNNYLTEHPVQSGATAEQAAQIETNKNNIVTINNVIGSEAMETRATTVKGAINELKRSVENAGGTSDIPEYSASDANKILSVNSDGTALGWVNASIGGSLVTRDIEDGEILTVSNEVIPVIAYGNIVTSVPTISINEGEEYEFTVRISPAPTVDQQVTISVNNGNCTVDRSSLTFTPNNYSVSQTVKVTGTHNSTDYTNLTSVISLASTKVETKKINVTVVNIDDPNPLNTISAVYNQGDTKVYPDTSLNDLKSNLVVTANYSDNSTQTVTDYSLSGTLTEGTSTITVTYREKTTTFNVTVTARPTLNTISAVYTQGDTKVYTTNSLDSLKSNLVVTANYSDNSTQTVTDYSLSGTLTEGTSTITVTYREKTTTFNVTVTARPTLNTISAVYTQGDTKVYTTNSLDSLKSNLVVTANYSDNSTQTVTDYSLSGTLTEGTSTITVTYREKTTTFNVTVTASETPVLTSITSEFNPGYSKVYTISSVNSLKPNLVVTAHYNDDSTQTVSSTDYSLSGTLTEGTSTITVNYEDKTDTFDVNVEVLEINENSNAYIKDGYLYLNTASINRAGNIDVRNNATTPDPDHQYFGFNKYTNCGYSGTEITYENAEKRHNNVIEFAGENYLDKFNSGNIECADFAYIKSNSGLYYRIPTSAYEAAGNDIINALASAIPKFPTLINPNKTLTIYTITDEIIDSITKGSVFNTATVEGESHTGFLSLDPNITGIKENISCETSLGGVAGPGTLKVPMDHWYTNVNGSRLNYSIPYGKIPGNTVDDIKAYLKANRLIFYKFN